MWIVIALIALAILGAVLWVALHALPRKQSVCHLETGELKSGKTFIAVRDLLYFYKKEMKRWRKGKTIRKPVIYSTIPIIIGHNWKYIRAHFIEWLQDRKDYKLETRKMTPMEKCQNTRMNKYYIWSDVLTRDMILLRTPISDRVLPLWLYDDVGASASQYSYADPNVITDNINENWKCFEVAVRYFAHHNGGDRCRIRATEQRYSGLCINLRSRMGSCDVLSDFHRVGKILPFFKVNVDRMSTCDDNLVQNVKENNAEARKKQDYYIGFLPYKRLSLKHYDSEAYEPTKTLGFSPSVPFTNWSENPYGLKTTYCPDLRATEAEKRAQKARTSTRATV